MERRRRAAPDHGDLSGVAATATAGTGSSFGSPDALLASVTHALGLFFRDVDPSRLFEQLLGDLIALTESEYGYIAETLTDDHGAPYLQTWAVTSIAWNSETRQLYEDRVVSGRGLEFRNLNTLFGWGLRNREVVMTNDAAADPRAGGVPPGHAPLRAYLGIPIVRGGELVGQLGVANRVGGYDDDLVTYLRPFVTVVGNLIEAYRSDRERRDAQAALAHSQRELDALVTHLSDIVTILEPDGSWRYSSPAGTRRLGYPRGYETPAGVFGLLHPDDVALATQALAEIVAGTRTVDEPIELRVSTVDGSYRIFETVGEDLRADPAIKGIVLTSHDVTDRRAAEQRLEETLAQLGALVAHLRDAVLFVDDERRVVFANDAFREVFGYVDDPLGMVGRPVEEIRRGATDAVVDPKAFVARVEEIYVAWAPVAGDEVEIGDGRVLERDYVPVPLDGGRHGHLWLYRDVTEQRSNEAQRERMLERERDARTATEEQNRSLQELAALKDEFVSTVSHELRTPVTSVVTFAGLLRDDAAGLPEEQQEFASIIERNAMRLLRLVDDLLLLGQLESGLLPLAIGGFDVRNHVDAAIASIRPLADERGVSLDAVVDDGPLLRADGQRIDQVLANLLSNAVKFTRSGGKVVVRARREPTAWCLEVRDSGIGIPKAERERLFVRFSRGSNAVEEASGTGLGLVITRAIVERHGGTIEVHSTEGVGTAFVVSLPDAPAPRSSNDGDAAS